MEPFIKINGHPCPYPAEGVSFSVSTLIDASRNTNAVLVGQRVGRDQYKIDKLEWDRLPASVWASILQEFSGFYAQVTFPDMVNNRWVTLKMYPGDRTAEPINLDRKTGLPKEYIHCKVNIIDVGE